MSDKSSDSRPSSQPSALLLMATAEYGGLSEGAGHSLLLPAPIRTAGSPQMLSPGKLLLLQCYTISIKYSFSGIAQKLGIHRNVTVLDLNSSFARNEPDIFAKKRLRRSQNGYVFGQWLIFVF